MSFQCGICQAQMPPRTPAQRVVVRKREKEYPPRLGVYHVEGHFHYITKIWIPEHEADDPGGKGWEIEKEILACGRCKEILNAS